MKGSNENCGRRSNSPTVDGQKPDNRRRSVTDFISFVNRAIISVSWSIAYPIQGFLNQGQAFMVKSIPKLTGFEDLKVFKERATVKIGMAMKEFSEF